MVEIPLVEIQFYLVNYLISLVHFFTKKGLIILK